jgi:hypothetical protein
MGKQEGGYCAQNASKGNINCFDLFFMVDFFVLNVKTFLIGIGIGIKDCNSANINLKLFHSISK